jgi:hypothetical protein
LAGLQAKKTLLRPIISHFDSAKWGRTMAYILLVVIVAEWEIKAKI